MPQQHARYTVCEWHERGRCTDTSVSATSSSSDDESDASSPRTEAYCARGTRSAVVVIEDKSSSCLRLSSPAQPPPHCSQTHHGRGGNICPPCAQVVIEKSQQYRDLVSRCIGFSLLSDPSPFSLCTFTLYWDSPFLENSMDFLSG